VNVEYHRDLIGDPVRLDAYVRAIQAVVRPGDIVLDPGAGTGLLSMIAARAGARRVYAIENHPVIQVAREVIERNGLTERITCIQADAGNVELPEKANLVISDLIGVFGVDLDILRIYAHLRAHCLEHDARVLPRRIEVRFCPWQAPKLHEPIQFWDRPLADFDVSAVRRLAANRPVSVVLPKDGALAEPKLAWTLDLKQPVGETVEQTVTFEISRPGSLHGIGGWFLAELSPGVFLDSAPGRPTLPWRQGFMPLTTALTAQAGDRLELTVTGTQEPAGMLLGWRGNLQRGDTTIGAFQLHQFLGETWAPPDLASRGGEA
jgi:hypothetical protein